MHPAAETYRDLLQQLDRWFEAARSRHGDVIPCRSGCTACCHGLFDISVADQLLLRETIAVLPPGVRAGILARAERLLDRLQAVAPEWGPPWDIAAIGEERFDEICLALHDAPCPLLGPEGGCEAYAGRPLVCRLIGLPMLTAGGDVLENACPIQEQFPGYHALDPLAFDLEALEDVELAALEASALALWGAPLDLTRETTIAAVAAGQEG